MAVGQDGVPKMGCPGTWKQQLKTPQPAPDDPKTWVALVKMDSKNPRSPAKTQGNPSGRQTQMPHRGPPPEGPGASEARREAAAREAPAPLGLEASEVPLAVCRERDVGEKTGGWALFLGEPPVCFCVFLFFSL